MIKEFKEFIMHGSVIDLAVGMIIGGAFTAIVNALVEGVLNPIIGALTAGVTLDSLSVNILGVDLVYGLLISAIIKFLIIALFVFLLVKSINSLRKREEVVEETTEKTCPHCKTSIPVNATRCPNCISELEGAVA